MPASTEHRESLQKAADTAQLGAEDLRRAYATADPISELILRRLLAQANELADGITALRDAQEAMNWGDAHVTRS